MALYYTRFCALRPLFNWNNSQENHTVLQLT